MRDLLQNGTFVRLFAGRVSTDCGDSLYYIATMWLLWELTHSPVYTAIGGALIRLPDLLSVFVGPLVDRWPLRSILLWSQGVNCVGVLIIPVVALSGQQPVWLILTVIPVLYTVNGFVYPAQTASLPRIVSEDALTRANSLFSTSLRTVDAIANAVGGLLIGIIGPIGLYLIDAGTFVIAAICFRGIAISDGEPIRNSSRSIDSYSTALRDGVSYVRGSTLLVLLGGLAMSNLGAAAVSVILPAYASTVGGPVAYGVFVGAIGLGGILGAAGASVLDSHSLGTLAIGSTIANGALLLVAVGVSELTPTALLLFASSLPGGAFTVIFTTMVQSVVAEQLLGRVSALIRSCLSGVAPLGSLLGGIVAGQFSPPTALYGVGVLSIAIGCFFFAHPGIRRLPPVNRCEKRTLGLQAVADTEGG
ncbi:MFS transporter [Halocatena halophila]|uniref:MFS transporter n=1 Tax=Halocatena halophila TaxID=2814576 RepID=UPI002ED28AE7